MKFIRLTVVLSPNVEGETELPMWVCSDHVVTVSASLDGPGARVRVAGGKDGVNVHESEEDVRQMLCDCGALFFEPHKA